ncbi:major capsid protein [Dyadobacter sp. LHD-138]|uniref:major capsid protein n=1 Tax=Dyadobacter sp. LHD-138 TaxID=3071413 RepID=UPI0027E2005C|nr:major capsid protein [Dyadobacter sp. LHD-138]MDQ6482227.1 major capsid protein [Dyadobacter sp. LHD-138]
MEQSMFIEWVKKHFGPLVSAYVESINGSKNPLTYRFKSMLTVDYSVTGKWEAVSAQNSLVAADIVAFDSPLPLKMRDSISKQNGEIPKIGMELALNERQLTELEVLRAQKGTEVQLLRKLFADTPRVIGGVYETLEGAFLQALSTGTTLIQEVDNVGVGVRIDYGIPIGNKFGVAVLWSNPTTAKPLDDIQRLRKKVSADGNAIGKVMLDNTAFDNMVATTQIKEAFANSIGYLGQNLFAPDFDQLNTMLQKKYKFVVEIVDRVIIREKNGVKSQYKPWADGQISFLPGDNVGTLTWSPLAELSHPVAGVEYQVADEYILASKYRTNRPSLAEFTSSQARVLPVLTNVDQIYLLDTKTVQA